MYLVLQAVLLILLLLNDAHYKSDCILLAIFREMLNKSYFKLLAYVPTLPRLLVLHKMLQHFLWNIVNITEIQERCSAAWGVCCTNDAGFALTTLRGTRQVARVLHDKVVSFCIDIFIFVSMYHIVHKISRCTDISMYRFTPNSKITLFLTDFSVENMGVSKWTSIFLLKHSLCELFLKKGYIISSYWQFEAPNLKWQSLNEKWGQCPPLFYFCTKYAMSRKYVLVQSQVPRMLVTWAVHRPIVIEYHT